MRKTIPLSWPTWLTAMLCCFCAQAQESIRPQNVNISSPNAASLGQVVDLPIGYNTGTPNVDIPIYTIETGPLKVPISLGYHASGLKVNQQASWVGAGWSLNAGGVITRTVRGAADEKIHTNATYPISYLSKRGFYDYAYDAIFNNPEPYNVIPEGFALADITNGIRDAEADLFTFNFNGYSGKFYFRADTSITIAPAQDIHIKALFCEGVSGCSTATEYLYGWIVTTPDGVKYHFGKSLNPPSSYNTTTNAVPIEHTDTYSYTSGISHSKTASSWFLTKIVSPDQRFTIQFTYAAENYAYYTTSLFPMSYPGSSTSAPSSSGIDLVKNIMSGIRLSRIDFANDGQVVFVPTDWMRKDLSSPQQVLNDNDQDSTLNLSPARALAEIQISSGSSTPCRTFRFRYGYFYDNASPLTGYLSVPGNSFNIHTDRRRLRLDSLTERSCDGAVKKPGHGFAYFDTSAVPRTLSFAQDHWGYFNGATANSTMLPALSKDNGLTNLPGAVANRESAWPAMRAGALKQIEYPGGGSVRFAFSNHEVLTPVVHYDSVLLTNEITAFGQGVSATQHFSLDATYIVKLRPELPSAPLGGGTIHIVNTATNHDYGSSSTAYQIFELPAGNYDFWLQSNSTNPPVGIKCKIWKMVGTPVVENFVAQHVAIQNFTSTPHSFTITEPTVLKTVRTLMYDPLGSGKVHVINTSSLLDYGSDNSRKNNIFILPAGSYQFSVESTSGTAYPITYSLYELSGVVLETKMVGGLRVDSVIYNTGLGSVAKVQTFNYNDDNGEPQGVLLGRPSYINMFFNHEIRDQHGLATSPNSANGCVSTQVHVGGPYLFYISAASVLPMRLIQGNHIGYSRVRASQADGGYTIYNFKNGVNLNMDVSQRVIDWTECDPDVGDYPVAPEPFDPYRGELVQTRIYNSNDVLLSRTVQSTQFEFEKVGVDGILGASYNTAYYPTFYEWKSARKVKSVEESFVYNSSNPAAAPLYKKTTTFYSSRRHNQPTRVLVTGTSDKILNDVRTTYIGDVLPPDCDGQDALDAIDAELLSDIDSLRAVYPYITATIPLDKYTLWQRYHYNLNKIKKAYISAASNSRVSLLETYRECLAGSGSWSYSGASPELKLLVGLKRRNQIGLPIESIRGRNGKILDAQYIKYTNPDGDGIRIHPGEFSLVKVATALDTTTFTPVSFGNTAVTHDSRYQLEETYDFFNGNISRVTPKSGVPTSYIWNTAGVYPIAQIQNGAPWECAFTSFEEHDGWGEGGWSFPLANSTESKTGVKGHSLNNNQISKAVNSSLTYVVSFWAKGGVPSISAGVVSSNDAPAAEADGWRYFEKTIAGVSAFQISGAAGVYIDELRLYPKGAQMTTYTYLPLVGISSTSDPNNRRGYFDYDGLSRLRRIRDSDRDILKQYHYNYRVTIP